MDQQFEIIELQKQPALSVRQTASVNNMPMVIGQAYHAIIAHLDKLGEQPAGIPFVAYYNMDMENLDIEIGFPTAKELTGQGQVSASYIPAGKAATFTHKGPYQEMAPAYDAINLWLAEQKQEPTGVVYEFYYNSPAEVPETELLTKVVFILK
ncbi:MAG: GyrI-like domain-containing protein [Syntrophomonadaceae bacterium]|nr:GyrI-like domain-containing protein [Syntrophomonadaceae bacterium]